MALPMVGTSEDTFCVFFCVFQDLCEFVIHRNKRHIFLCFFLFFSLLGLLVKMKHHCRIKRVICFEWYFYHLFWRFPSLDFSQLGPTKNDAS